MLVKNGCHEVTQSAVGCAAHTRNRHEIASNGYSHFCHWLQIEKSIFERIANIQLILLSLKFLLSYLKRAVAVAERIIQ